METEPVVEQHEAQSISEDVPKVSEVELSKRQRKKLEKRQKLIALKKIKRAEEKLKRKAKRKEARDQGILPTAPTRKELKKNKCSESAPYKVAIDLSFDELMIDKDISSCASQLLRIYSSNRRAKMPIPIYFTGLKSGSKMHKKLEDYDGSQYWDVVKSEQSYLELFDREKIVYLTSEAEETLTQLETDHCYVIGGLVDHNFHKGLTFENAQKEKIKTAKLPLHEHINLKTRTVLTINQCFEILLGVSEGKSWRDIILEVMPQRKVGEPKKRRFKNGAKEKEGKEEDGTDSATNDKVSKIDEVENAKEK